ncbi:hypothetical protein ACPUVO_17330 [Pseudocolwellia sp. HL-MZ19]|uniref:hypothetical protein n=1 Tax=unclassified Pseudocolwellia TaxID=2848178 RepID=UPI003CF5953C
MIINTIILFLRDLLPIFILFGYLHVFIKRNEIAFSYLSPALTLGVISSLLFFGIVPHVSELFEGTGIERTYVALLLITYSGLFFINSTTSKSIFTSVKSKSLILVAAGTFIVFKASAFLIFFDVYFQQQGNSTNILIGCIIGLGICASFTTLFTFILTELLESNKTLVVNICWALFLAGQLSQITIYLSQVDLINIGPAVINFSTYIKDQSEYGHVLKALIGFEESPSKLFIFIYSLAFTLPFLAQLINTFLQRINHDE